MGLLLARDTRWRLPIICAVAATLPDADFVLPVLHRGPTHSLIGALGAGAAALALSRLFASIEGWRLAAAVALAVLTHVLFDWLSADSSTPRGLMALWPWTSTFYISDLDVFEAVDRRYWRPGFVRHNTIAVTKEILILGPVALLVLLSRRRIRGRSFAPDDPRQPSA